MSQPIVETVERVLAKAPQWLRHDLQSPDALARARAEEALAAMIGAALEEQDHSSVIGVSAPAN